MTRADVTRLAQEHGYNRTDPSWLTRAAASVGVGNAAKKKPPQRSLVDLTFQGDHLVAVREGTYAPGTTRVVYHSTNLCQAAQ